MNTKPVQGRIQKIQKEGTENFVAEHKQTPHTASNRMKNSAFKMVGEFCFSEIQKGAPSPLVSGVTVASIIVYNQASLIPESLPIYPSVAGLIEFKIPAFIGLSPLRDS